MGIFDRWLKRRPVKLTDHEFWRQYYGHDVWSGESVSAEGAMQLSAWWACVRLISETIATLPLGVFERTGTAKRPRSDHALYELLHNSPNADMTAVEFWEGQVASLCIWGNGYSQKEFSGGRLVALTPLPGMLVMPYRTDSGVLRYKWVDQGKTHDLPEEQIFHIRGFGVGGDLGLSPVAYARQTLGIATSIGKAAGETFHKGMRSKGFFTFPTLLTPEQREQAHKSLVEKYSGAGAPNVGVLEAGVKFEKVAIDPDDAEMLLSWRFSVEEICRWHRVPPILIGHAQEGQTMFGSGVEQINLGWLTYGLRPYLSRIEQAIRKRLLTVTERQLLFAEFNVEGLLRADSAGRAALYSTFSQNGIMNRNEIRAKDNLPPVEGGDILTVQANLVPLTSFMPGEELEEVDDVA